MKEYKSEWEFLPADHWTDVYRWQAYHKTMKNHADPDAEKEDFGAYLPNPDEVNARAASVRWLQHLGFSTYAITSIMIYDMPNIKLVRILVRRIGPERTIIRLEPFYRNNIDF